MKSCFNNYFGHQKCLLSASLCQCFGKSFLKHIFYRVSFGRQKFSKFPFATTRFFVQTSPIEYSSSLEAMHHWKHLTGQPQLPIFPITQISIAKSSCSHLFPHLAIIWRSHIDCFSLYVSNPSSLGFSECAR